MKTDILLQLLSYTIPALVVAGISYVFFQELLRRFEKNTYLYLQHNQNTDIKAFKLQAYERLIVLMERIDLSKLTLRVEPIAEDKNAYLVLLTQHIEQEFEYNMSQQVYVSNEVWNIISNTKNNIIYQLQTVAAADTIETAHDLRRKLLSTEILQKASTQIAILAIKEEVKLMC